MLITEDVNVPEPLISALENDTLVVFAGAGVSMNKPSGLPNFQQLASRISEEAGNVLTVETGEPLDRFLGRLKGRDFPVHTLAQRIILNLDSKPADLHKDLLLLFERAKAVRVVTTNFDKHFTTAGVEFYENDLQIYRAPALPRGNDFRGLVYLHGCVDQEPEELVLTDADFGRAYLTEGWATQFLKNMFSSYVVLFVGYSHNDIVMQYLARGLPPNTPRFAFTEPGRDQDWKLLGIVPVNYQLRADGNPHGALTDAIAAWVELKKKGALDHEQRIKEIAQSGPLLSAEDADYLILSLKESFKAKLFGRYAEGLEWLRWIEDRSVLDPLFKPEELDEASRHIAKWFADKYVTQHSGESLALIQGYRQNLNPVLWTSIAYRLYDEKPEPTVFSKWVQVLLNSSIDHQHEYRLLTRLLGKCSLPEDESIAILLFKHLTEPRLNLKASGAIRSGLITGEEAVSYELSLPGDRIQLESVWADIFTPNIKPLAPRLVLILASHLQKAHYLLRSVGKADEKWDLVSRLRAAIEPDEQNRYPGELDVLIDATREVIEALLLNSINLARSVILTWGYSDVPLLKRLAIHGIAEDKGLTPDEKIEWLLEKKWLYDPALKHEVFRLLAVAYSNSTETVRLRVLNEVEEEAQDNNDKQFRIYERLNWLYQNSPNCSLTAERFNAFQKAHPQFEPSERPDLDIFFSSRQITRQIIISPEGLLSTEPSDLLDQLLAYEGKPVLGLTRDDLLSTVSDASSKDFAWGMKLADALIAREEWQTDLWESVIRGWSRSELNAEQWAIILELLKNAPRLYFYKYRIADFLLEGLKKRQGALPSPLLPEAEKVVEELWNDLEGDEEDLGPTEPPVVKLVHFWLYALARHVEEAGNNWAGLPEMYKAIIATAISSPSAKMRRGCYELFRFLNYLFNLDPAWARVSILPALDWSKDAQIAQTAWNGYLMSSQWDPVFGGDLMPFIEGSFDKLDQLNPVMRNRFCGLIAYTAVYKPGNPLEENWLTKFLLTVEAIDRKSFADNLGMYLNGLRDEQKQLIWVTWLASYWLNRTQGIPRELDIDERSEMVNWVFALQPVFESVVDKICASPPPPFEGGVFYIQLEATKLPENNPNAVARLIAHLLSAPQGPFPYCDEIEILLGRLLESNAPREELRTIRDRLIELGCELKPETRQI